MSNWSKQSYIDEFLSLKCAGDIINISAPVQNMVKEVQESMAIIKYIKKIYLRSKKKYIVLDLCAGNALTSIIARFLKLSEKSIAIDKLERKRDWHLIDNFQYINLDIHAVEMMFLLDSLKNKNVIIVGVHACKKLAKQMADIYHGLKHRQKQDKECHLLLMPCCEGSLEPDKLSRNTWFYQRMSKYEKWCYELTQYIEDVQFAKRDTKISSPKNIIIYAKK